jgi:hypothetical protein
MHWIPGERVVRLADRSGEELIHWPPKATGDEDPEEAQKKKRNERKRSRGKGQQEDGEQDPKNGQESSRKKGRLMT